MGGLSALVHGVRRLCKKPESGKLLTPESPSSTVPMVSTLDMSKNALGAKMDTPSLPPPPLPSRWPPPVSENPESGKTESTQASRLCQKWGIPKNGVPSVLSHLHRTYDLLQCPKDKSSFGHPCVLHRPNGPTICKAKRDAAIMEKHKDGMSNNAIAKMFNMVRTTVDNVVNDYAKNAESAKLATQESSSSTSTVPMASTLDRADTREDAEAYVNSQWICP